MTDVERGHYKKTLISSKHFKAKNGNHERSRTTFYYCKECGRTITAERSIPKRVCGLCADSSLTPDK